MDTVSRRSFCKRFRLRETNLRLKPRDTFSVSVEGSGEVNPRQIVGTPSVYSAGLKLTNSRGECRVSHIGFMSFHLPSIPTFTGLQHSLRLTCLAVSPFSARSAQLHATGPIDMRDPISLRDKLHQFMALGWPLLPRDLMAIGQTGCGCPDRCLRSTSGKHLHLGGLAHGRHV